MMQKVLSVFDNKPLAVVFVGLFFILAPLDLLQLVMAFVGAVVYGLVQVLPKMQMRLAQAQSSGLKRSYKSMPYKENSEFVRKSCSPTPQHTRPCKVPKAAKPVASTCRVDTSSSMALSQPACKPTAMPIAAPIFKDADFNSQVDELVAQIMPTLACDKAVADIVGIVRQAIQTLVPEAEVTGFACGSLKSSTAYGVAVPEVDIVVSARPADLTKRLQGRLMNGARYKDFAPGKLDLRKLHKSALRVCTSLLVSAGFKFRRSSFRSSDPKVTVMAPTTLGVYPEAVPLDFSMNNTTPFYNMALFTECGQIEPRAKDLILLVKRWAKDRGICHAAKGHLPPYAWSLMVIYFLQVGVTDEGALLPPVQEFALSSELMANRSRKASTRRELIQNAPRNSLGDLFKKFVKFYTEQIDWHKEAVSVRLGERTAPNLDLEIHIVVNPDGSTAVSPIIEDPFNTKCNVGTCTNAMSLSRFFEEFERAKDMMSRDEPLSKLLELWRPPLDASAKDDCDVEPFEEGEA